MRTDTLSLMYEGDRKVSEVAEVPPYIEQDIRFDQVAAIVEGGCASGAYMPAVEYHTAMKTMSEYSDRIDRRLAYSERQIEEFCEENQSFAGLACNLVSWAVEEWACDIFDRYEQGEFEDK